MTQWLYTLRFGALCMGLYHINFVPDLFHEACIGNEILCKIIVQLGQFTISIALLQYNTLVAGTRLWCVKLKSELFEMNPLSAPGKPANAAAEIMPK